MEPAGCYDLLNRHMNTTRQQIIAGSDADLIVFETMTDLFELKAAVLAAKENSDKPIIATMSFVGKRQNLYRRFACLCSDNAHGSRR